MREPIPNEITLVEQAVAGSTEAFGRLYVLLRDRIYAYIRVRVANDSDAEDLTSQVFLKAWEAMPRYEQRDVRFASWLYRIAHNVTLNHLRDTRHATTSPEVELLPLESDSPTAIDELIAKEERDYLVSAIEQLPEVQRKVIQLRFFEDRSYPEIAAMMTRSMGALRVIQHRALHNLSQFLNSTLAIVLLIVLMTSGLIYAAEDALPGDVNYPVKHMVERTWLSMAGNAMDAANLRLTFAVRRIGEADALASQQRMDAIASVIDTSIMQLDAVAAALSMHQSDNDDARMALAERVITLQPIQRQRLLALDPNIPAEARLLVTKALTRWQDVDQIARRLVIESQDRMDLLDLTPTPSLTTVLPGALMPVLGTTPSSHVPGARASASVATLTPAMPTSSATPTGVAATGTALPMGVPDGALTSQVDNVLSPSPTPTPTTRGQPSATALLPTYPPTESLPTPSVVSVSSPPTLTYELPTPTATSLPPTPTATHVTAMASPSRTSTSGNTVSGASPIPTPTATPTTVTPTTTPTASLTPTVTPTIGTTLGDLPFPVFPDMVVVQHQALARQIAADSDAQFMLGVANGKATEVHVRLVEILPPQLQYVARSASTDASYDTQTNALIWEDVVVPARSYITISFAAHAGSVELPTPVVLVAQATADGAAVDRDATPLMVVIFPNS